MKAEAVCFRWLRFTIHGAIDFRGSSTHLAVI